MATDAGRPAFDPAIGRIPDPNLLIAEAQARTRRRRRRNAGIGAAVLAAIGVMYVLSGGFSPTPPHGSGPEAGSATPRQPDALSVNHQLPRYTFGSPVEVDGMTFVVEKPAAVRRPIWISPHQRLLADHWERVILLTVTVRNDGATLEADPFCRGERGRLKIGPEVMSNPNGDPAEGGGYHRWWRQSRLIAGNDLCGELRPGATGTYQLLFSLPKRERMAGVMLQHRAPDSKRYTFAFVSR